MEPDKDKGEDNVGVEWNIWFIGFDASFNFILCIKWIWCSWLGDCTEFVLVLIDDNDDGVLIEFFIEDSVSVVEHKDDVDSISWSV